MSNLKVFVDSDVIISSLISSKGAAFHLLNQTKENFYISNSSVDELEIVVKRLNIDTKKLDKLLSSALKKVNIGEDLSQIKKQFALYVRDPNDCHIISGTKAAKAKFLITYNIRDFKVDKIKKDLNIIVTTPARFLQYLRSKSPNG